MSETNAIKTGELQILGAFSHYEINLMDSSAQHNWALAKTRTAREGTKINGQTCINSSLRRLQCASLSNS